MKETILLKQITPMWHFEPDIKGCCLRATEVKPKLDRFLLSKEKEELGKYKIGDTEALDYKLSFDVGKNKSLFFNAKNFRLFFGNMGDGPKKELKYYEAPFRMMIFTLHENLMNYIKKHICEFFATHSFGTRQDKGFGCFFPCSLLENGNIDYVKLNLEGNQPYSAKYKFTVNINNDKGLENVMEEVFKYIEHFHKYIRSGINIPGRDNKQGTYYKSLMFFYAKEKGCTWEKPYIRHYFELENNVYKAICGLPVKDRHVKRDEVADFYKNSQNDTNFKLFREALGLASIQEWKDYRDVISLNAVSKDEDNIFVRFKSPINYRPFIQKTDNGSYKCDVYIFLNNESLEDIKKQSFTISNSNKNYRPESIKDVSVFEGFDLEDYFQFILRKYDESLSKGMTMNEYLSNQSTGRDYYVDKIFNSKKRKFCKI